IRFYPSRARRSSCWSTCPPPVSAGMRVPCANQTASSTQHQRYHLLSAADLKSSRNRNFVHMKGERSGVVGPAFSGGIWIIVALLGGSLAGLMTTWDRKGLGCLGLPRGWTEWRFARCRGRLRRIADRSRFGGVIYIPRLQQKGLKSCL